MGHVKINAQWNKFRIIFCWILFEMIFRSTSWHYGIYVLNSFFKSFFRCDNCSGNAIAIMHCVECNDFLCLECLTAHRRVKITKGHTLNNLHIPKKLIESLVADIKCSQHLNEDNTWFCVTCKKWTCSKCQMESHFDHMRKAKEVFYAMNNYSIFFWCVHIYFHALGI